ncbi:hypothetical protein [Moraxella lacunata]
MGCLIILAIWLLFFYDLKNTPQRPCFGVCCGLFIRHLSSV